jgi:hypothetical protein
MHLFDKRRQMRQEPAGVTREPGCEATDGCHCHRRSSSTRLLGRVGAAAGEDASDRSSSKRSSTGPCDPADPQFCTRALLGQRSCRRKRRRAQTSESGAQDPKLWACPFWPELVVLELRVGLPFGALARQARRRRRARGAATTHSARPHSAQRARADATQCGDARPSPGGSQHARHGGAADRA